jgi:hypothetical protein
LVTATVAEVALSLAGELEPSRPQATVVFNSVTLLVASVFSSQIPGPCPPVQMRA